MSSTAASPAFFHSGASCAAVGQERRSSSASAKGSTLDICSTYRRRLHGVLLRSVAGALSFALVSSPVSFAEVQPRPYSSPYEMCKDIVEEDVPPESVMNEEVVEEAWEVVNESFLGGPKWSEKAWMKKKEDVLHTNIRTRSEAHDIIRKMLSSLGDPYTRFLSPDEFSKMARYDMTGIGINLREVPDESGAIKLKVLGVILNGPAHSAGVRQGDELLAVNGVDVRGKSAFDVSSLLQGPNETFVSIEVKHGNCGSVQSMTVQRQFIARTPVFYRVEKVDNQNLSVGYIHVKEFNALAKKDIVLALNRLQKSGVSYFVLDLSDNLGGLVQVGIEVAKLFLNKGETVISTVGRDPQVQKIIVADSTPLVTSPLIVLVNNRTASASEIVAAALHDNCKAVLVGKRTFGKALIQSVFELRDGSGAVVTVGKYVTPDNKDITGNGIKPDFANIPEMTQITSRLAQCQSSRKQQSVSQIL